MWANYDLPDPNAPQSPSRVLHTNALFNEQIIQTTAPAYWNVNSAPTLSLLPRPRPVETIEGKLKYQWCVDTRLILSLRLT
jgi:hypothetical protein